MTDGIAGRLRAVPAADAKVRIGREPVSTLAHEAADLIEAQQAEIERLRAENVKQRAWIVSLEMELQKVRRADPS